MSGKCNGLQQVPNAKPEPYHGSAHAMNYRAPVSNYHQAPHLVGGAGGMAIPTAGSNLYEMMSPSGMLGGGYPLQLSGLQSQQQLVSSASPFMTRFGLGYGANSYQSGVNSMTSGLMSYSPFTPKSLMGGASLTQDRLPYAFMQAPSFPFGSRKYKGLMPMFK